MTLRSVARAGIVFTPLLLLSCSGGPSQPEDVEAPEDPFHAAVADEFASLSDPSVPEEERTADWEVLAAILELFETTEVGG
ncbi:MAG: hypothetical protein R3253_05455 [Longimicrobiales bacterium]|nr:hypothetical protein [Longimicrobiales bacterium]